MFPKHGTREAQPSVGIHQKRAVSLAVGWTKEHLCSQEPKKVINTTFHMIVEAASVARAISFCHGKEHGFDEVATHFSVPDMVRSLMASSI